MKPSNLITAYQGASALEALGMTVQKKYKKLKSHEIRNLHSFCDEMNTQGCNYSDFDGFFIGYSIGQIGKEFDLLRFGNEYLINIEIKSELKVANKNQKILDQMRINYYYLRFLGRPIYIFTYVENDGFYKYNIGSDSVFKTEPDVISECIKSHKVDYSVDPNKEFVPSNYLISPFNSTVKFLSGEYFLTSAQQRIKDEINAELHDNPFMYFCISANAGTGKTLLMYDIAKEIMKVGKSFLLIHCGKLNSGHTKLITEHGWRICSIGDINNQTINSYCENCSIMLIDESQRIREHQLQIIVDNSIKKEVPIIFSYDTKQYLRNDEGRDISEYIRSSYPEISLSIKQLTTRIRTNKQMASFINNLVNIGSSKDHLNFDCVTIEFTDKVDDLRGYVDFLRNNGWEPITYTTSQYSYDPYGELTSISEKNAHDVIGQEFSKVVFVMDENFKYGDTGQLMAKHSYYSARGMLYQIVTRAVDELKIIVFRNPVLYKQLLEIKAMGDT